MAIVTIAGDSGHDGNGRLRVIGHSGHDGQETLTTIYTSRGDSSDYQGGFLYEL